MKKWLILAVLLFLLVPIMRHQSLIEVETHWSIQGDGTLSHVITVH